MCFSDFEVFYENYRNKIDKRPFRSKFKTCKKLGMIEN